MDYNNFKIGDIVIFDNTFIDVLVGAEGEIIEITQQHYLKVKITKENILSKTSVRGKLPGYVTMYHHSRYFTPVTFEQKVDNTLKEYFE